MAQSRATDIEEKEEARRHKRAPQPLYEQRKQDAVPEDSRVGSAEAVLNLQQTYGNRYVQRVMGMGKVQAKLIVNPPDDQYEKEADRIADAVTEASTSTVRRQVEEEKLVATKPASDIQRQEEEEPEEEEEEEEEEPIQTKLSESQPSTVSKEMEADINAVRGSGQPLPDFVRSSLEPRFKHDFSQVNIHTDARADKLSQQLGAKAFTSGNDVFFRKGAYQPGSDSGRGLIAHELTHVVQQGNTRQETGSTNMEIASAREEANTNANDIVIGNKVKIGEITSSEPMVHRQEAPHVSEASEEYTTIEKWASVPVLPENYIYCPAEEDSLFDAFLRGPEPSPRVRTHVCQAAENYLTLWTQENINVIKTVLKGFLVGLNFELNEQFEDELKEGLDVIGPHIDIVLDALELTPVLGYLIDAVRDIAAAEMTSRAWRDALRVKSETFETVMTSQIDTLFDRIIKITEIVETVSTWIGQADQAIQRAMIENEYFETYMSRYFCEEFKLPFPRPPRRSEHDYYVDGIVAGRQAVAEIPRRAQRAREWAEQQYEQFMREAEY